MELALNLAWALAALSSLALIYRGVRGGSVRVSMTSAMMLAMLLCFILLPVISVSDDLLDAQQAALPLSGQTWRNASEGISSGLDQLLAVALFLMLLMCFLIEVRTTDQNQWSVRPLAGLLVRCQRLRPPPCPAK